ncbi:MAG: hypothetical protein WDZ48_08440, partial [Pirellulales bacterium]
IDNVHDYNRSGNVTVSDAGLVFSNLGTIARINIGTGGPFAPEGGGQGDGGGSAVASALTGPGTVGDDPMLDLIGWTPVGSPVFDKVETPREQVFRVFALNEESELGPAEIEEPLWGSTEFRPDAGPFGLRAIGARRDKLLARGSLTLS